MARDASDWLKTIAHADMDAFYAAIEQLDDPSCAANPFSLVPRAIAASS